MFRYIHGYNDNYLQFGEFLITSNAQDTTLITKLDFLTAFKFSCCVFIQIPT
jgi:hypothetical protein